MEACGQGPRQKVRQRYVIWVICGRVGILWDRGVQTGSGIPQRPRLLGAPLYTKFLFGERLKKHEIFVPASADLNRGIKKLSEFHGRRDLNRLLFT